MARLFEDGSYHLIIDVGGSLGWRLASSTIYKTNSRDEIEVVETTYFDARMEDEFPVKRFGITRGALLKGRGPWSSQGSCFGVSGEAQTLCERLETFDEPVLPPKWQPGVRQTWRGQAVAPQTGALAPPTVDPIMIILDFGRFASGSKLIARGYGQVSGGGTTRVENWNYHRSVPSTPASKWGVTATFPDSFFASDEFVTMAVSLELDS